MRKSLFLAFLSILLLIVVGCASDPMSDSVQTPASSEQSLKQPEVPEPTRSTSDGSKSVVGSDKPLSPTKDNSKRDPKPQPLSLDLSALGQEAGRNPNLGKCLYEALGPSVTELNGRKPTQAEIDLMIPCVVEFAPHLVVHSTEPAVASGPPAANQANHVIHGRLVNVSNPQPQYLFHEQPGCVLSGNSLCHKIEWEKTGNLVAGGVTHIAISKSSPDSIYVGYDANDMSVWKSNDSGVNWSQSDASAHVSGLAVHPTDPNVIIYSVLENNLYRSDDAGLTWSSVLRLAGEFRDKSFTALAFSESRPSIAYAATSNVRDQGGNRGGGSPADVLMSNDSGRSWTTVGTCHTCGVIHTIAVARQSPETVFAAGSGGVYKSTDTGKTWEQSFALATIGLSIKPGHDDILAISTMLDGVYRSEDGGNDWIGSSDGLDALDSMKTHRVTFASADGDLVYLTTHNGIFTSHDSGKTWRDSSDGLGYRFVHAIAVDPEDPNVAYVGTASELNTTHSEHMVDGIHDGEGLYKTTDGGKTWAPSGRDISESGIEQMAGHPLIPYTLWTAGAAGRGAYVSRNGGSTWLFAPFPGAHYPMVFDFSNTDPNIMYLTSWAQGGELGKSIDGGSTWSSLKQNVLEGVSDSSIAHGLYRPAERPGSEFIHLHGLAVAPSNPEVMYVGSVNDTRNPVEFHLKGIHVFRSDDAGISWSERSVGLPIHAKTSVNALAVDPRDSDTVYAMTSSHESDVSEGVYKTIDGGQTWNESNKGLRHIETNDIQIDPLNPDVLYLAMDVPRFIQGTLLAGVYKSIDGADSWKPASDGLPDGGVTDLAIDALSPNIVYAATREGVYMSNDGAMNWVAINDGLPKFGRDVTFSHDRVLEIDAVGRAIYAAVRMGEDARDHRTIYRAVVKPDIATTFKYELESGSGISVVNLESTSNIWLVRYDEKGNELQIGVAGPAGTDGYVKFELPRSLLGSEQVSVDAGQNIKSSGCESDACIVHYRHTDTLTITLKPS